MSDDCGRVIVQDGTVAEVTVYGVPPATVIVNENIVAQVTAYVEPSSHVVVHETPPALVEVHDGLRGPQGLPGPPGADGDSLTDLQDHINSPTPHPAYDVDMPSLKILFENGIT